MRRKMTAADKKMAAEQKRLTPKVAAIIERMRQFASDKGSAEYQAAAREFTDFIAGR
jgi:transcription elongation GreA/GreB family factor